MTVHVTGTFGRFQSRYRAASHFRCEDILRPQNLSYSFQSRYRAASHFRRRMLYDECTFSFQFQSRYRAASHFRLWLLLITRWQQLRFNLVIERLLISGSQRHLLFINGMLFQSRYRAASHFRSVLTSLTSLTSLFQSRYRAASHFRSASPPRHRKSLSAFQSRYRAASHFRPPLIPLPAHPTSFNLVIERLLISGGTILAYPDRHIHVSISLSSGFSFQAASTACHQIS